MKIVQTLGIATVLGLVHKLLNTDSSITLIVGESELRPMNSQMIS